MNSKRPRSLDLNAPLLSTRRSITTTGIVISHIGSLSGSSYRAPFSWEQSPGKPKDRVFPLPKTIRWQDEPLLAYHNDNGNDDDDGFSDAIDLFSLAESLNTWDDLDLGDDDGSYGYESSSPSFMMQRFLPAATALAASSVSALATKDDLISSVNDTEKDSWNIPRQAYSSSKGCGLEIFFPWRTKHRLCPLKNPVRRPPSRN